MMAFINGVRRFLLSLAYNLLGLVEFLLFVRVVLMALSANPGAKAVAYIYSWTNALLQPVAAIFPNIEFGKTIVDLEGVAGMVFYAIIGWLVIKLISIVFRYEQITF